MKPHPNLKSYCSGQLSALDRYGFDIWDLICGQCHFYDGFRLGEAAKIVENTFGLSNKTALQYTSAVLHNVLLDQDEANPCLEKLGGGWRLRLVEYS